MPDNILRWQITSDEIATRIKDGVYPAGTWLPTIKQLSGELGVSTSTVNRAIWDLNGKGMIVSLGYLGCYVGGEPPSAEEREARHRELRGNGNQPERPGASKPTEPRPEPPGDLSRDVLDDKYLTVNEIAGMLRVSKMSVYRLVRSGELPSRQFGRQFRVPENSVIAYLHGSSDDTATAE